MIIIIYSINISDITNTNQKHTYALANYVIYIFVHMATYSEMYYPTHQHDLFMLRCTFTSIVC